MTNTSCVTGIEHADEFFPRIEVEMQRRSAQLATLPLVIIADGAGWIWDRVDTLVEGGQQVWHILDFWHACEHLAKISRLLYGDGSDRFKECFKRWRGMLRNSRGAAVIEELSQLRDSGKYPQLRDDLQGEIDYFTANQQRMDYRRYRDLGLPIGSGTVESACKNVVAARMKTERHDVGHARSHRHAPAARVHQEPPLPPAITSACSLSHSHRRLNRWLPDTSR